MSPQARAGWMIAIGFWVAAMYYASIIRWMIGFVAAAVMSVVFCWLFIKDR
jgi:hypothetical protein